MSNAVYPVLPGLAWPVRRTPLWKTKIGGTPSGREFRSSSMLYPRYRIGLQYEFLRSQAALAEFQSLFGFFNARGGAFDDFLFSDPSDCTASGQLFATGNGSMKDFQLMRTLGGHAHPVYDVDTSQGLPQVWKAGSLQSTPAHYTISSTGMVSFGTAPANGQALTWSGRYYWRCRFEADELPFEQFLDQFWKTGEVRLISCKP